MSAALPRPAPQPQAGAPLLPTDEWYACRYCGHHAIGSLARRKHERDVHEGARER